jgi:type I restriction enzyme, R subunit
MEITFIVAILGATYVSGPEAKARENIDSMLEACGWNVQDLDDYDFSFPGVAIREFNVGRDAADYLLFLDGKAIGVVEAKPEGTTLSGVRGQTSKYTTGLPSFVRTWEDPLPFCYESTGIETFFRDLRDPDSRGRRVFSFHRPETLKEWIQEDKTLRKRLREMPPLKEEGLRKCQICAIKGLEKSLAENRPRALIQMATGSGKTYTMVTEAYRLIKHAKAKRILFLVDRTNLGKQANGEFDQYRNPDDGRKFPDLYITQHLKSNKLDKPAKVVVSTIQRMYSMLKGSKEEPDEALEATSQWEKKPEAEKPLLVEYNNEYPIETFDFIITDECHRSIYNLWRQVLEYFDASIIGLTATPSSHTYAFFNQNIVSEYDHESAVADRVNVGYDVYRIKTQITENGCTVEAGEFVDRRDKLSRDVRWEQLDQDLSYEAKDLDRSIVAKDQIRTVIRTFRDRLPEIFPNRTEVPKTIIFAKDDNHAEDILEIVLEEFGRGDDFCVKITYKTTANTETLLTEFKTVYNPRIVVSVDMISTGTDIKPVECLVFMRDVKSRVYFEQMKGRGTRVIDPQALQQVNPPGAIKDHFVIVDAVGVCESDKTDLRPLERKKGITFDKLLFAISSGARDEDSLMSLGNRLSRLNNRLNSEERNEIKEKTGLSLSDLSRNLFNAIDPDAKIKKAIEMFSVDDPDEEQLKEAYKDLAETACMPFKKRKILDAIIDVKRKNEQTIDSVSKDELIDAGFDPAAKEKALGIVDAFKQLLVEKQDELVALQILYNQPYESRQLTYDAVRELASAIEVPPIGLGNLWRAYNVLETDKVRGVRVERLFADVIQLVRFAIEEIDVLEPYGDSVDQRFIEWLNTQEESGKTYNEKQLTWLTMIKNHIKTSVEIGQEDFETVPFNQHGRLHEAYKLFGEELNPLLNELNTVLNN